MGLNSMNVKRLNRNSVLRYMLKQEEVSKANIADELNLSIPTVTQSLKELYEMRLVQEAGTMDSSGGRKAMSYICIKTAKVAVGVDITRNHINIVIIDLSMNPLYFSRVNFRLHDEKESYQELKKIIDDAIKEADIDEQNILGLGISIPAIVDDTRTKLYGMHEEMNISDNIYNIIKDWYPFPVILGNDADNAGHAEMALRGSEENTVYFFVSPSVGGSIVLNGKPYYGQNRRAGEFGHMILVPGGKKCYCGRKGCVNSYCSTELLSAKTDGNLREYFRLLSQGDEECVSVWEEYLDNLALAIHNLMSSFDMEIIIGGYLGQYIGDYIVRLEDRVRKMDSYLNNISFIKPALLKYEASAVGIAMVFTEKYIENI